MSEELIEITCVGCGRTIRLHDRMEACPVCNTNMAGYKDDALDIVMDELTREMREIVHKMARLGFRIYERNKK